jgi:hypothetical protein
VHVTVVPNRHGKLLVAHHRYRVVLRLWVSYTALDGRARSIGFYGLHLPAAPQVQRSHSEAMATMDPL